MGEEGSVAAGSTPPDTPVVAPEEESGRQKVIEWNLENNVKLHNLNKLVNEIETVRGVPCEGFDLKLVMKKIWQTLFYGTNQSVPTRLQDLVPLGYWTELRLCVPVVLDAAFSVTTVLLHILPGG